MLNNLHRFFSISVLLVICVSFCTAEGVFAEQRELPVSRQKFANVFNSIAKNNNLSLFIGEGHFREPWGRYVIANGIEISGFVNPSGSFRSLDVTLRLNKSQDYIKFLNTVSCLIDVVDPSIGQTKSDLLSRLGLLNGATGVLERTEIEKNGFEYTARSYEEGQRIRFSVDQSFAAYRANSRRSPRAARKSSQLPSPTQTNTTKNNKPVSDPFASSDSQEETGNSATDSEANTNQNTPSFSEEMEPQKERFKSNEKTVAQRNHRNRTTSGTADSLGNVLSQTAAMKSPGIGTFPYSRQAIQALNSLSNTASTSSQQAMRNTNLKENQSIGNTTKVDTHTSDLESRSEASKCDSTKDFQVLEANCAPSLYPQNKPTEQVTLKPSNVPAALDRIIKASLIWNGSSLFNDPERQKETDDAIFAVYVKRPPNPVDKNAGDLYRISLQKLAQGQRSLGADRELLLMQASAGLETVHKLYPKWVFPLCWLADCEVAQGNFTKARAHFIETLLIDPWWSMPWHELGFIFAREGDNERALGCLLLGYRFSRDTSEGMFNIQNMRYGKDKVGSAVGTEAMKRISASELTYLVKCAISFIGSSYTPTDGVIELAGLRPGLNSPIREGAQFQKDREGLFKADLSNWMKHTMEKDIRLGGVFANKKGYFKARLHIDRVGKTSDVELLQSSCDSYTDKQLLDDLRRNSYDKLPAGASDVIMELAIYLGQPIPQELK